MRATVVVLLLLVLALEAAPAGAEIRLLDPSTGAARTLSRDDFTGLVRWTDDGSALLVRRQWRVLRVGVADGATTEQSWLDHALAIGPGGRSIFYAGYPDARVELRGPDGVSLASYALDSLDEPSISWSPDGTRVAVMASPELLVLDTSSGAVVARRRVAHGHVSDQAFAPDSSALVVTDGPRVLRVELTSAATSVLVRTRSRDVQPAATWGTAGPVAVTLDRQIRILDGGGRVVPLRVDSLRPALWNPDGSALSYGFGVALDACSYPRDALGLLVPGQAPRVLIPPGGAEVLSYAWSPDGRQLAVALGPDYDKRGRRHPWPGRIARSYGMFSRRGDAAIRRIVVRAARALRRGAGREQTLSRVRNDFHTVASRFSEADDTAVREALGDELDKWLAAAGFSRIDAYDEITC